MPTTKWNTMNKDNLCPHCGEPHAACRTRQVKNAVVHIMHAAEVEEMNARAAMEAAAQRAKRAKDVIAALVTTDGAVEEFPCASTC